MEPKTEKHAPISRGQKITLAVFVVVFLVPSSLGFIEKLHLFMETARSTDEGSFAMIPVANYLIVFLGMLCLLGWAIVHGMFRDIEGPKYTMLDRERRLDEQAGKPWD